MGRLKIAIKKITDWQVFELYFFIHNHARQINTRWRFSSLPPFLRKTYLNTAPLEELLNGSDICIDSYGRLGNTYRVIRVL